MSAPTLTLPDSDVDSEEETRIHLTCCNDDIAMCGVNVSGDEWDHDGKFLCPTCAYMDNENLPCPVPGCVP